MDVSTAGRAFIQDTGQELLAGDECSSTSTPLLQTIGSSGQECISALCLAPSDAGREDPAYFQEWLKSNL